MSALQVNPPLAASFAVAHTPADLGDVRRLSMLRWATWCLANRASFTYTEGPGRGHMVSSPPGSLPQSADCSGFVTGLARWAGATDPNPDGEPDE